MPLLSKKGVPISSPNFFACSVVIMARSDKFPTKSLQFLSCSSEDVWMAEKVQNLRHADKKRKSSPEWLENEELKDMGSTSSIETELFLIPSTCSIIPKLSTIIL
uniref:Uncharacterized protein n=1 Tax=Chaetoceros debilis TaxID=122233 RepID=A0A7S3VFU5_9STRA|mmetsp:Transcript_832/g.1257  ORF Transcript_832/g.1257 Transcript_832/m.1257 type:complete len:105 (+) Transcript_832:8-322(+)